MQKKQIKNIILLYFGKQFSELRQVLFGRWLLSSDDSQEKEDSVQELWDITPSQITLSTYHDWKRLQKSINQTYSSKASSGLQMKWQRYAIAAVILAMIMLIPTIIFLKSKSIDNIEMAEVFVAYGESKEVLLPDNSKAWINAGSLLVYPKSFDQTNSRTIYLTGEASFEVTKNQKKPFIVKTTNLDIQALGTVFTVQAYPSSPFTLAMLEEGSVRVDVKTDRIQSSVLKESEQLIYSHLDETINISTIDISMLKRMREGYQIFENTPFQELMKSLERRHNVVIHYDARKYANNDYNVKFAPEESIEDIMNVLKQLIGLRFKIEGNVIYIN